LLGLWRGGRSGGRWGSGKRGCLGFLGGKRPGGGAGGGLLGFRAPGPPLHPPSPPPTDPSPPPNSPPSTPPYRPSPWASPWPPWTSSPSWTLPLTAPTRWGGFGGVGGVAGGWGALSGWGWGEGVWSAFGTASCGCYHCCFAAGQRPRGNARSPSPHQFNLPPRAGRKHPLPHTQTRPPCTPPPS
jgi:hypothetical protein